MTSVILFTSEQPGVYLKNQIYDPVTNPSGNIIPQPGSLVIDISNNSLLQHVVSVDAITLVVAYGPVYTSLIAPATPPPESSDPNITSLIDYGNTRFYLFYDKSENPTKLNVDKKTIIIGDDAKVFEICRYDTTLNQYIPISLYYNSDGIYQGTKIPLIEIDSNNNKIKIPTNCQTTFDINDNEIYFLNIYDYAGTQCGSLKLFAKQALINNSAGDDVIITDFILTATQMADDKFYLYPEQDPSTLMIDATAIYSDGQRRNVAIDNMICHLYGLEGFMASYPGQETELLVKYFLEPTQQAMGDALVVSGNTRCLARSMTLIVKDPGNNDYNVKILVVPRYLSSTYTWTLMFYLYNLNDTTVRNVTALVNVSPAFDGKLMGVDQNLILSLNIKSVFPDAATDFIYQQPIIIKVNPYSYFEKYTFRDSIGDTYGIYGVDSPIVPRPVLYYDETLSKYFIPTNKFNTSDVMLESFYFKTRPLYDNSSLTTPSTPTHFTIRDAVSGIILLTAPIAISNFYQAFSLINVSMPNQLVGLNCIVEFLQYVQGTFVVLYGAPVDVTTGTFV